MAAEGRHMFKCSQQLATRKSLGGHCRGRYQRGQPAATKQGESGPAGGQMPASKTGNSTCAAHGTRAEPPPSPTEKGTRPARGGSQDGRVKKGRSPQRRGLTWPLFGIIILLIVIPKPAGGRRADS